MDLDTLADQYASQGVILSKMPWLTAKRMAKLRRQGLKFVRTSDEFVYRLSDLERALEAELCQETESGSMAAAGSAASMAAPCSTSSGTTTPDEELAAEALERAISNLPRQRLSAPRMPPPGLQQARKAS